jgi:hypothetical protein
MVVHPLKVAFFTVHPTGNIGIHIIGKRGKIWLLGISLLALIHHPIGIDPPMDPNPSKVEFLDQNPSRLLSMSTLLAQQTLKCFQHTQSCSARPVMVHGHRSHLSHDILAR